MQRKLRKQARHGRNTRLRWPNQVETGHSPAACICGGEPQFAVRDSLESQRFVSGRTVSRRNRFIVQPEINAELSPMVYQVIQEHFSVRQKPRAFKKRLALKTQFPVFLPGVVGHVLEHLTHFRAAFIKCAHQLLRRFHFQWLVCSLRKVQTRACQHLQAKSSKLGHMWSQPAQCHRLAVRLVIFLVGRYALQESARSLDFCIKFGNK
jgi:hypothetical protein